MNVLVIGGLGYIGIHTILCLKRHACKVSVLTRHKTQITIPGVDIHYGNYMDEVVLDNIFQTGDFDAVVNLAYPSKKMGPKECVATTYAELEAMDLLTYKCQLYSVYSLVYASSSAVYSPKETGLVKEDTVVKPKTPYGVMKAMCEETLKQITSNSTLKTASLRIFNTYGLSEEVYKLGGAFRKDLFAAKLIEQISAKSDTILLYTDCKHNPVTRDMVHVDDVANAIFKTINYLGTTESGTNLVVNIGSGTAVSVPNVFRTVRHIAGRDFNSADYLLAVAPKNMQVNTHACIDKASTLLGWTPHHLDLWDGLSEMWKYR